MKKMFQSLALVTLMGIGSYSYAAIDCGKDQNELNNFIQKEGGSISAFNCKASVKAVMFSIGSETACGASCSLTDGTNVLCFWRLNRAPLEQRLNCV